MEKFKSVDEILDFAINAEQEAINFYLELASQAKNPEMKEVFLQFSREEETHKARLKKIKEEGVFEMAEEQVSDLKVSDYVVKTEPTPGMSYDDALILAMHKEKAAFKLYTNLEQRTDNPALKKVFRNLAIEESKHKLRFEIEYDEYVMREN